MAWLGVSPEELNEQVADAVWARWVAAEADLAGYAGLEELHALRGLDNDPPLGALVRLAAQDGGNDLLAAVALAHQMERGARSLMHTLRDLGEDVDEMVMSALWVEIRCFPWRRRTRAYAANLMRDTRASVLETVGIRRRSPWPGSDVLLDPQSPLVEWLSTPEARCRCEPASSCEQTTLELVELLDWALASDVIERDDAALLLDLVAAGEVVADQDTPWTRRGICSQAAVRRVAERRGVCGKTIRRRRDRIVAALRESTGRYLADVA